MRVAELCAGYGGLGLAMQTAGWPVEVVWYAENDPDASAVMTRHHPGVPNLGDITAIDWTKAEPVDILAAGYPCQDLSKTRSRRCGAPISDARRRIQDPTYPMAARSATTRPNPRARWADTFSKRTSRGRSTRTASATFRQTPLRAPSIPARLPAFILAEPADADGQSLRQQLVAVAARHRAPVAGQDRPHAGGLMPTPGARLGDDRRGTPSGELAAERMDSGRRNLDDAVALLPTPAARDSGRGSGYADEPGRPLSETVHRLLPTPRASDSDKAGPNQRGSAGDLALMGALALLPTPTATNFRGNAHNGRGEPLLLGAVADRWAQYGDAIRRWEDRLGRPAPDPTVLGKRGGPQLSHHFVEWMIGLPQGYVTDVIDRKAALRVLGNGLVPQQGAVAYSSLAVSHA